MAWAEWSAQTRIVLQVLIFQHLSIRFQCRIASQPADGLRGKSLYAVAGHGGTEERVSIWRARPSAGPPHKPGAIPVPNTIGDHPPRAYRSDRGGVRRCAVTNATGPMPSGVMTLARPMPRSDRIGDGSTTMSQRPHIPCRTLLPLRSDFFVMFRSQYLPARLECPFWKNFGHRARGTGPWPFAFE